MESEQCLCISYYKSGNTIPVSQLRLPWPPSLSLTNVLHLTWKPYSSMQQCPRCFLPEWPRLPGCLERNFLWTSKSHEIERWIKKLKKQNCCINPMKMPSTPRTVYPLSLWFLSNVLMSRHLRLMIRLAMAVLFKWSALQSILLTFFYFNTFERWWQRRTNHSPKLSELIEMSSLFPCRSCVPSCASGGK